MDRRLKNEKKKTEGEVFPSFEAVAQGHSLSCNDSNSNAIIAVPAFRTSVDRR